MRSFIAFGCSHPRSDGFARGEKGRRQPIRTDPHASTAIKSACWLRYPAAEGIEVRTLCHRNQVHEHMATENPYQSTAISPPSTNGNLMPSNGSLWRAYLLAPAVAPVAFVALLFLVGIVSVRIGVEINEASFVVLPILALTIGVVGCYLVAGFIGMPIAFYLRRANALNGRSIHGAALCWAILFSAICSAYMTSGNWSELPLALCYVGAGVVPPVLLSGTAFWLLVRRFPV
jgi:hypothetical protein